jgi:[NiFe] hydrogenase diaphorase moiety large subunit
MEEVETLYKSLSTMNLYIKKEFSKILLKFKKTTIQERGRGMKKIELEELHSKIFQLKEKYGGNNSAILQTLIDLQEEYRELSQVVLQEVAHAYNVHPAEIQGTASFYSFLKTEEKYGKYIVRLCRTISCELKGKERIAKQLENELGIKFGETTSDGMFTLEYCNCLGMCDQGPAIMVDGCLIPKVKPAHVPAIIDSCRRGALNQEFDTTIVSNVVKKGPLLTEEFYPGKVITDSLGKTSEEILEMIEKSELRGRGGAGFSTGLKWKLAAKEESPQKFVICNADEGEPGTFKDRYILHREVHRVIEGMTIAARCIGANKGYIYLRGEYSYLKDMIEDAIIARKEKGLLGDKIGGLEGFDFDIDIRMGAGAYICGEETALIESLEGKRGEPRNRPPYPVDTGFMNNPTIVNNVETFLNVTLICEKGVEFFKEYGTSRSTGTKFFSVSGDIEKAGIYELPFGITIAQLMKEVGCRDAKAVQVGGAAGVCIPSRDFDKIIAYEAIPTGGSIIIFNDKRDMLDIAQNFMEFFVDESCGQCTPCREGTTKILEGIKILKQGKCSIAYLNKLKELAKTVEMASKCGLGQLSMKAFLSIVNNFQDEVLGRLPKEGSYETV